MRTKLKTLLHLLLQSPRRFPVELALGVAFFVIAVWHSETNAWNEESSRMVSEVNSDILWLFVPLVVLSFWLQRVNRWVYLASFFLFMPLMALNLKPFLWTYGFVFTYVLAAILLVVGNRRLDNRSLAAHALHVVTQMFFGLVITATLNLAVLLVVASFLYIFGINEPRHIFEHIFQFIWFILAPQICCSLIRQNEDEVSTPFKVIRLILDFILSPAVIVYTVILYTYFIKIAFEWDLPKGGVAWMVMGFITVALIGRVAQSILNPRYYDWLYRRFTLIAIPPLIMYWIGSIYRIRLYSFTESRFYLMVAGVLMTLFVLMLFLERTRRYQLMLFIFGAAIILFTYIPGISAKRIGLNCQERRLRDIISELKLTNEKTGKLKGDIDMNSILKDSLLCEKYRDASSVISYVRKEIGTQQFEEKYGRWLHSEYNFNYNQDKSLAFTESWYDRKKPVELGEYNILLPDDLYECDFKDQMVTVRLSDGAVVLEYPIGSVISKDPDLRHHPEQLMSYHNDSLMLVFNGISISDSTVTNIKRYDFQLFGKQGKSIFMPK
jgi:hypothetical protein